MTILSVAALLLYFSLFLLCSPQWPQAAQHYTATALLASWTTLSLSLSLSDCHGQGQGWSRYGVRQQCVMYSQSHSLLPLSAEEWKLLGMWARTELYLLQVRQHKMLHLLWLYIWYPAPGPDHVLSLSLSQLTLYSLRLSFTAIILIDKVGLRQRH